MMLEDGFEVDIMLMVLGGFVELYCSVLVVVLFVFSVMFQYEWKGKDIIVDISDMSNEVL